MSVTRVNRIGSPLLQPSEDYPPQRASFALFGGALYSEGRRDLLMKDMERVLFRDMNVTQVYMQDDGPVGYTAWMVYHPYDGDGYTMYFFNRMNAIKEFATDEYAEIDSIELIS